MFEGQTSIPNPTPNPAPTAGAIPPLPQNQVKVSNQQLLTEQAISQEAMTLMKREGLTTLQKVLLLLVTAVVLAALIGGGVLLYRNLKPLDGVQQTITNTNTVSSDDPDQDTLTNLEEAKYHTDGNNADTDADGITDGDEVRVYRTDPVKADTDGDGYLDGNEVTNGYDPNGPGRL